MRRTGEKWKTAGKWKMIGRGSAAGRNRLAAVFCAAAVVCAQGISPAFAALKEPEYWKAATYYSDDWVANFWNSESVHMEEELARIAADGFNSIILAVPWKEFQPSVSPGAFAYEAYAYEKLDRVLRAAKEQGLWVFLRVGYTWDFGGGSMDADRYRELVSGGRAEEAWLDYAASLYEACWSMKILPADLSPGRISGISSRTSEIESTGRTAGRWPDRAATRNFWRPTGPLRSLKSATAWRRIPLRRSACRRGTIRCFGPSTSSTMCG